MSSVAKVTVLVETDDDGEDLIRDVARKFHRRSVIRIDETYDSWDDIKVRDYLTAISK